MVNSASRYMRPFLIAHGQCFSDFLQSYWGIIDTLLFFELELKAIEELKSTNARDLITFSITAEYKNLVDQANILRELCNNLRETWNQLDKLKPGHCERKRQIEEESRQWELLDEQNQIETREAQKRFSNWIEGIMDESCIFEAFNKSLAIKEKVTNSYTQLLGAKQSLFDTVWRW